MANQMIWRLLVVLGFGLAACSSDTGELGVPKPLDAEVTDAASDSESDREFLDSLKPGRWKLIQAGPNVPDGDVPEQGIYFATKEKPGDRAVFYGEGCHTSVVFLEWEEPGLAEVVRDETEGDVRTALRRCGEEPAPGIARNPPAIGSFLHVDIDGNSMTVQLEGSTGVVEWEAVFEHDEDHLVDGLPFTTYDEGRTVLLQTLETVGWKNEGADRAVSVGQARDSSVHSRDETTVTITTEWGKHGPTGDFGGATTFADLPGGLLFADAPVESVWFSCRNLAILINGELQAAKALSNVIWDNLTCAPHSASERAATTTGHQSPTDFTVGSRWCLAEQETVTAHEIVVSTGDGEGTAYDPAGIVMVVPAGSSFTVSGDNNAPVGDLDGDGELDTLQFIDISSPDGEHLAEGIRVCGTSTPLNSFFVPSSNGNFGALVVPFPASRAGVVNRGPTTDLRPEDVWLFDHNGDLIPPYARNP